MSVPGQIELSNPGYPTLRQEQEIVFTAGGETLRIVSRLEDQLSELRHLRYGANTDEAVDRLGNVYWVCPECESDGLALVVELDGTVTLRTRARDLVVRYLTLAVCRFMSQKGGDQLHVHAASVSFQGRGIMLPGATTSGKSTLTLALLLKGCRYLSDDLAVLQQGTFRLIPAGAYVALRPHLLFISAAPRSPARLDASLIPRFGGEGLPVAWEDWNEAAFGVVSLEPHHLSAHPA